MYCPRCGSKIEDSNNFCSNCGAQISIFKENLEKFKLFINKNNNVSDSNIKPSKSGLKAIYAIPAIILYTAFMYVMIFDLMGYHFSFSSSHYDYFLNELEMSGFTESDNVYSLSTSTTTSDNKETEVQVIFDLNNNYFSEIIDGYHYVYTYDYANDLFILEYENESYPLYTYDYDSDEYECVNYLVYFEEECSDFNDDMSELVKALKSSYNYYMESFSVDTEDIVKGDL